MLIWRAFSDGIAVETPLTSLYCGAEPVNSPIGFEPDNKYAVALLLSCLNVAAALHRTVDLAASCVASVFIINGFTCGVTAVRSSAKSMLTSMLNCCCKHL